MVRYSPIIVGVLLLVGLTYAQVRMTDRFAGANFSAEQQAELLNNVPMNIGDWRGEDLAIDEAVKKTAGAVGAVSRRYRNSRTGEQVDLWLIVGRGRAISNHTPDICYRSSGFTAKAVKNSPYTMVMEDDKEEVPFLTNIFFREDASGRSLVRVFWTWYNSENESNKDKVVWEAPQNARWIFGNTRALYKMYFTSQMRDQVETADQSPCIKFAEEFMPVVNKALSQVHLDGPGSAATAESTPAEKPVQAADEKVPNTENPEAKPTTEATPAIEEPAAESEAATK